MRNQSCETDGAKGSHGIAGPIYKILGRIVWLKAKRCQMLWSRAFHYHCLDGPLCFAFGTFVWFWVKGWMAKLPAENRFPLALKMKPLNIPLEFLWVRATVCVVQIIANHRHRVAHSKIMVHWIIHMEMPTVTVWCVKKETALVCTSINVKWSKDKSCPRVMMRAKLA